MRGKLAGKIQTPLIANPRNITTSNDFRVLSLHLLIVAPYGETNCEEGADEQIPANISQ